MHSKAQIPEAPPSYVRAKSSACTAESSPAFLLFDAIFNERPWGGNLIL